MSILVKKCRCYPRREFIIKMWRRHVNSVTICLPQPNLQHKRFAVTRTCWFIKHPRSAWDVNRQIKSIWTKARSKRNLSPLKIFQQREEWETWSVTFSGTAGILSATRGWAFCWRKEIICQSKWVKDFKEVKLFSRRRNRKV